MSSFVVTMSVVGGGSITAKDNTTGASYTVSAGEGAVPFSFNIFDSVTFSAVAQNGFIFGFFNILNGTITVDSNGDTSQNPVSTTVTTSFVITAAFAPSTGPAPGLTTTQKILIAGGAAGAALVIAGVAASKK